MSNSITVTDDGNGSYRISSNVTISDDIVDRIVAQRLTDKAARLEVGTHLGEVWLWEGGEPVATFDDGNLAAAVRHLQARAALAHQVGPIPEGLEDQVRGSDDGHPTFLGRDVRGLDPERWEVRPLSRALWQPPADPYDHLPYAVRPKPKPKPETKRVMWFAAFGEVLASTGKEVTGVRCLAVDCPQVQQAGSDDWLMVSDDGSVDVLVEDGGQS